MRVVVTGGGTAGHVTPLLAVASELKRQHPRAEIRYIGNYGDKFAHLAQDSTDIDGHWLIVAGKFRRYYGVSKWVYIRDLRIMLKNFRDLFYFGIGFFQSVWLLVWWRPKVLFAKGGYVCLPVGLAAAFLRIPIVTHDSDTVPGLTNRVLARYARFMAVAMPEQYYSYPKDRIRYTGLPIRADFAIVTPEVLQQARFQLGIPDSAFVVAVFGGSQGAIRVNNAVVGISADFLRANPNHWIIHQTGGAQFETVQDFYRDLGPELSLRVKVWPFIDDVHLVSAAADVIVSRAGSICFELGIQQKAVILIPNPVLTGGHQTINARVLSEQGSVVVVTEKEIIETKNTALLGAIQDLESDPNKRTALGIALSKLAKPDAAANIVSVLKEAMR